jgi:hypothetical protein
LCNASSSRSSFIHSAMSFSLGQIRFCCMCGGARGARGHVLTKV